MGAACFLETRAHAKTDVLASYGNIALCGRTIVSVKSSVVSAETCPHVYPGTSTYLMGGCKFDPSFWTRWRSHWDLRKKTLLPQLSDSLCKHAQPRLGAYSWAEGQNILSRAGPICCTITSATEPLSVATHSSHWSFMTDACGHEEEGLIHDHELPLLPHTSGPSLCLCSHTQRNFLDESWLLLHMSLHL